MRGKSEMAVVISVKIQVRKDRTLFYVLLTTFTFDGLRRDHNRPVGFWLCAPWQSNTYNWIICILLKSVNAGLWLSNIILIAVIDSLGLYINSTGDNTNYKFSLTKHSVISSQIDPESDSHYTEARPFARSLWHFQAMSDLQKDHPLTLKTVGPLDPGQ